MSSTEIRYKRLKLGFELRQALSREGVREMLETWRAVLMASRRGSTYASELRVHCLAGCLAIFALLPFPSLVSLRVFSWSVPEMIWALGMFVVASHGWLQMFRTKGDVSANEDGRARALILNSAAFTFLFVIQVLTSWEQPGTIFFPFVAYVSGAMALRLAKHGP